VLSGHEKMLNQTNNARHVQDATRERRYSPVTFWDTAMSGFDIHGSEG